MPRVRCDTKRETQPACVPWSKVARNAAPHTRAGPSGRIPAAVGGYIAKAAARRKVGGCLLQGIRPFRVICVSEQPVRGLPGPTRQVWALGAFFPKALIFRLAYLKTVDIPVADIQHCEGFKRRALKLKTLCIRKLRRIVLASLVVQLAGLPLVAQDFLASIPSAYRTEYDALLSDPANLERIYALARRAELDARDSSEAAQYRLAMRLYERMILIDPTLTQVRLRLGEIHFRLGEYVAAQSYFRDALQDPTLPADIRDNTQRFLDEIDRRLAPMRFEGRAVVGIRYQSNPTLDDDEYPFFLFTTPQGDDFDIFGSVGLTHTYDPGWQQGHTLVTTLDAATQRYFKLNEIDSSSLRISLGPQLNLGVLGFGDTSIRPYLLISREWLAGDWYATDRGGGLEVTVAPMPRLRLSADVSAVSREHNPDQGKGGTIIELNDGDDYRAEASAVYRANERVAVGVSVDWQESNDADFVAFNLRNRYTRRSGVEVFGRVRHAALAGIGTGDWTSSLALGVEEVRWYEDSATVTNDKWRTDTRVTVAASTEVPVTRALNVVGGVTNTDFSSNFNSPDIDYVNWEVYLGVSHRF